MELGTDCKDGVILQIGGFLDQVQRLFDHGLMKNLGDCASISVNASFQDTSITVGTPHSGYYTLSYFLIIWTLLVLLFPLGYIYVPRRVRS